MKQKDILFFLIFTFVITVFWIGFNIHHNYVTSTISDTLNLQIKPITPTFDTETIQALRNRTAIQPSYNIDIVNLDATGNTNQASESAEEPVTQQITPQPTQLPQPQPTLQPVEDETADFEADTFGDEDPFGDTSEGGFE